MALIRKDSSETVAAETGVENEIKKVDVTETAPVVASKTSVPAVGGGAGSFFLNTPSMLQIVEEADTQTFDRIVPSSGNFKLYSTGKQIGSWIKFKVIAEKRKRSISPNPPAGDTEYKKYFTAAYDNQLSSKGNEIEEDLVIAKDAGYDKAVISEYTDLFLLVEETADPDADLAGEIITLQLARVARGTWVSFKSGLQMKAELRMIKLTEDGMPPSIKATAKAETNAARQDYTTVKFSMA